MAKISPVSIKYMIHANFVVEGSLEKPDVIGAIFGQTEGLLGADLEMRELQKEGKIGRIEVDLERRDKRTIGVIHIPTALDQSETTLIAAAIETIDRIGPSDAQIEVEKIEDVRGSKRDYILERAKKLMGEIQGSSVSREITTQIKDSFRASSVAEHGASKLPCGDLSDREIIVVEGRADVVNLLRNHVNNVIGMNGTKLPDEIAELGKTKDLILFVDGDRGGKLIIQNVTSNARIKYIAIAPEGKEVEELAGKEIWQALRKKISVDEYFSREQRFGNNYSSPASEKDSEIVVDENAKETLKKILSSAEGSEKGILLDESLNEMKTVSAKAIAVSLKRSNDKPYALVIDGTVTKAILSAAEEVGVKLIVAKNFATTDTFIKLLSL